MSSATLHERHRAVAGHWIPFERYLNSVFLSNRLAGDCGVLADGPDRLLREYAAVLSKAISSLIFPIRLGRPTGGTKSNAAGLIRIKNCRS